MYKTVVFSTMALLLVSCSHPSEQIVQAASPEAALAQAVVRAADKARAGAILDVQGCELDFVAAEGVANRKTKLAMPTGEQLRIASIGKLYTAAVIHQLVQLGLLDLGAPATSYLRDGQLDGVPNKDASLRKMLNHTSGVPDYYDARSYLTWDWKEPLTTDRVLTVARRRNAENEIGAEYSYSNTNYHILALVAEAVSGKPFSDLIQEQLLVPLQLTDTRYNTVHPGGTIHGFGTELRSNADTWIYAENTGPDSGITATTADLRTFLRALFLTDGVLSPIGAQMIQDPVKAVGDRQLAGPGAEIYIGREGGRLIGHTGDTYGYLTFAMAVPEYNATIIGHINANKPDVFLQLLRSTVTALKAKCISLDKALSNEN